MPGKSKPYRSKIVIGHGPDGKPIYKWFRGRTRAELAEARQRVITYYITGEMRPDGRLFGDYAAEWFRIRKAPFVAASTRNGYHTMLTRHLLPAFGGRSLRAIQPTELQMFVNGFAGASSAQITYALASIKGIFAAAVQDRLIQFNPASGLIRPNATPPKAKRALTAEERARLIELFPWHPHGLYCATLYYTGMRPGEVRGLRWDDIDWVNNLIHVQRDIDYADGGKPGQLKTRAANRFVPIADPLRRLLSDQPGREGYVFPGQGDRPLTESMARIWWLRLMLDCGMAVELPPDEARKGRGICGRYKALITPHALRHNFITMCWEHNVDILITMRIVGHSDYATTRNIYTHLTAQHLDGARADLNAMFASRVAEGLPPQSARLNSEKQKGSNPNGFKPNHGAPGGSRTHDLLSRSEGCRAETQQDQGE